VVDDVITTGATAEACASWNLPPCCYKLEFAWPHAYLHDRAEWPGSGTSMTKIILYTPPYCGYCRAAKHLLTKKGATFTEIDVSGDLELRQEMIDRAYGRRTVPQIFINGGHVGGYDELAELERAAELDPLLAEIEAVAHVPGE